MEQEIIKAVTKASLFSKMPKWLRVILIVLSIVTVIYWLLWSIYKLWTGLGKALHWLSDPKNWWLYTSCILILIVGGLLIAQFCSDLKPFTHIYESTEEFIQHVRELLADKVRG